MIDYDPSDSGIQLYESLYITGADGVTIDQHRLHADVSEDIDPVVNQARQACTCSEETKAALKSQKETLTESDQEDLGLTDEICLPCQARAALNALRGVAENS